MVLGVDLAEDGAPPLEVPPAVIAAQAERTPRFPEGHQPDGVHIYPMLERMQGLV